MFILIAILLNSSGSVTSFTQEFSNQASCLAAKAQIEQTLPPTMSYSNYRSLQCIAK